MTILGHRGRILSSHVGITNIHTHIYMGIPCIKASRGILPGGWAEVSPDLREEYFDLAGGLEVGKSHGVATHPSILQLMGIWEPIPLFSRGVMSSRAQV